LLGAANFYWRFARIYRPDFDPLVWSLIFGTLVALANSSDFWRVRFRVPGTRYLADRAYAVYLLHVEGVAVMVRLETRRDGHPTIPMWLHIAGIWAVTLVGAEVLHRLVEKPFMQAREKYGASRSTHGVPALENGGRRGVALGAAAGQRAS
jgi:peptidoglycan/LPS O-acetylase OafA/YrhL